MYVHTYITYVSPHPANARVITLTVVRLTLASYALFSLSCAVYAGSIDVHQSPVSPVVCGVSCSAKATAFPSPRSFTCDWGGRVSVSSSSPGQVTIRRKSQRLAGGGGRGAVTTRYAAAGRQGKETPGKSKLLALKSGRTPNSVMHGILLCTLFSEG